MPELISLNLIAGIACAGGRWRANVAALCLRRIYALRIL
jgi:hypothetical protein